MCENAFDKEALCEVNVDENVTEFQLLAFGRHFKHHDLIIVLKQVYQQISN